MLYLDLPVPLPVLHMCIKTHDTNSRLDGRDADVTTPIASFLMFKVQCWIE